MPCTISDIPEQLHRNGRPVVPDFERDEFIYRRFINSNEAEIFKLQDTSVNRSKFSQSPSDVLFNIKDGRRYFNQGIVQLKVSDVERIECSHPTLPNQRFTLKLIHDPEECMYPHSIIGVYLNGQKIEKIKPNQVKTAIRDSLMAIKKQIKSVD
jgi:hypothetical protein